MVTQVSEARDDGAPGMLTTATFLELEAAGRELTVAGTAAVLLAMRLDAKSTDTGSSVAALVRELRATMAAALAGVERASSPVVKARDELAARRRSA